jgi:predicted dehydrogenase
MKSEFALPRIGVIGGGHLGRIHAKLAANNPSLVLIGVADPSADSRSIVESQLNLPTVHDYKEWDGAIDGAIIAAPTFLHHEIGSWCLRHGIHVLMEKPIASSLRQASELLQLAKSNSCTLQVGHVERFNPAWQKADALVASQSIRYIEAVREGTYTGRSTDIGIVMDLMIHDIDLVLSAVNDSVESVQAFGWSVLGEHEDFATACLRFQNGTIAQLRASRIAPVARRQMQLYSEGGLVEPDRLQRQHPTRMWPTVSDRPIPCPPTKGQKSKTVCLRIGSTKQRFRPFLAMLSNASSSSFAEPFVVENL